MKYRVFNTQAQAVAAETVVSIEKGYPQSGINAASGVIVPEAVTQRWAVVQQIQDGRWVFESPDEEGVEAGPNWFPPTNGVS